jgi:class 3 adenylate cyclase
MREFTQALRYIEPGEEITLNVETVGGLGGLVVRDLGFVSSVAFFENPEKRPGAYSAQVLLDETGFARSDIKVEKFELEIQNGLFIWPMVHFVGLGPLTVRCRNVTDHRLPFWAVLYPPVESWGPRQIEFEPFLSAKRLLSTETFRRLFRAEAPGEGEGLSVNDLTYLFSDLKDSTAMYDEVGDATAYNLVRLHFDVLGKVIADNGGAVVKTVGDAVMATFVRPVDAVTAAQTMLEALDEFNSSMATSLMLKIGIHRGHSIAVALNERLDYFGQNVNIAARTQQLAGAGEILVSQDVLDSAGVAEKLAESTLEPVSGVMKGVSEEIPVFRVSAR